MSEHEEYTAETYPSFGKKYANEKAIISLTSWKARINTVSKTLYSLLKQCPGFHIVLVLSEEEFPKMMDELPDNLKLFVDNELIEVLWVYKNYRSFKKILFTMDKYKNVPIISADDDFIYKFNYAEILYSNYKKYHTGIACTTSNKLNKIWPHGYGTLYPPNSLLYLENTLNIVKYLVSKGFNHDDGLLGRLYYKNPKNKMFKSLNYHWPDVCIIHTKATVKSALSANSKREDFLKEERFITKLLKGF